MGEILWKRSLLGTVLTPDRSGTWPGLVQSDFASRIKNGDAASPIEGRLSEFAPRRRMGRSTSQDGSARLRLAAFRSSATTAFNLRSALFPWARAFLDLGIAGRFGGVDEKMGGGSVIRKDRSDSLTYLIEISASKWTNFFHFFSNVLKWHEGMVLLGDVVPAICLGYPSFASLECGRFPAALFLVVFNNP